MKIVFTALLLLLLIFQYRLWMGEGGLTDVHHLQLQKDQDIVEINTLTERNASLAAEVVDLKQGMEAIEERARSEMGMIKHNETFYRVIEHRPTSEKPR